MTPSSTPPMKVGIILPIAEEDDGHTPRYAAIREIAHATEAAGFDSAWVFDHLLFRFPDQPTAGIWECWTILAALAEATERVELGTLVMCTAFRNPALLAKMASTADEISGGRLILGLGAGWHKPEFDAFGLPFDHRVERFEEALQIIVPLLREGAVDFHGKHYSAPDCVLRPRGPRPSEIPILIAAKRPRMLRLAARYGDSWNTAWLGRAAALRERREPLVEACHAEGRDPASLAVTVGVTVLAPDGVKAAPEAPNAERTIFGSEQEVAAVFREYAAAGVAHLICSLQPLTPATIGWLAEALHLSRQ